MNLTHLNYSDNFYHPFWNCHLKLTFKSISIFRKTWIIISWKPEALMWLLLKIPFGNVILNSAIVLWTYSIDRKLHHIVFQYIDYWYVPNIKWNINRKDFLKLILINNWSKVLESAPIDLIQDSADFNIRDRCLQLIKSKIKTSCDWYNLGKMRGLQGVGVPCLTCVDVRIYMIFQFYFIGILRVFHNLSLTFIRYAIDTFFESTK